MGEIYVRESKVKTMVTTASCLTQMGARAEISVQEYQIIVHVYSLKVFLLGITDSKSRMKNASVDRTLTAEHSSEIH